MKVESRDENLLRLEKIHLMVILTSRRLPLVWIPSSGAKWASAYT